MFESASKYYKSQHYDQAIDLLNQLLVEDEKSFEVYQLLSRSYQAVGDLKAAIEAADKGLGINPSSTPLAELKRSCEKNQTQVDRGLEQIRNGQHTTPEINYLKANTALLIKHACFPKAIEQLRALAEARKAKTTNILWIGNYLKDVYFTPSAEKYQSEFDVLLFDEMLFYYLKACKLYEKGYQVVQKARKALQSN